MKKHKGKIQMGIVIGIFSVIIIACLISIFSRLYAENKEKEEFRQLAEVVTEDTTDATVAEETVRKPMDTIPLQIWKAKLRALTNG